MICTGQLPRSLLAAVLLGEGRAVGFRLGGCAVVFNRDVLCGTVSTVFVVSTVLNITANGLHHRLFRHGSFTPV